MSKAKKEVDPKKMEVIINIEPPTTVRETQRALGYFGCYMDIMPNHATMVIALTNFTRKDVKFVWTPNRQESFDILKAKLTSFSCFVAKDWDKHFNVYCDASVVGIGATLFQAHDPRNKDYPIFLLAAN